MPLTCSYPLITPHGWQGLLCTPQSSSLWPDNRGPVHVHVRYSTYYKPIGDLLYISSEQGGGLIIRQKLIYEYTTYSRSQ